MAVPKKKTSPCKRGMRNAHRSLKPNLGVECAECGMGKLPHHVCLSCGYHNGKKMILTKKDKVRNVEDEESTL